MKSAAGLDSEREHQDQRHQDNDDGRQWQKWNVQKKCSNARE